MKFVTIILLLLINLSAFGQRKEEIIEAILSFLPEGSYEKIVFEQSEFVTITEDLSLQVFSVEPQAGDLPAAFVDLWAGKCTVTQADVLLEEVTDKEEINSLSLLGDPLIINDSVFKVVTSYQELKIYHYLLLNSLLKEALENKQMVQLKMDNEDQIYEYLDGQGMRKFMAIKENYVLVAPEVVQLREMLRAQKGARYGFFFQSEGRILMRMVYKLEGNWSLWTNLPFWRSLLAQVAELDDASTLKYIAAGVLERGCIHIVSKEESKNEAEKVKYRYAAKIITPGMNLRDLDIVEIDEYIHDDLATGLGPKHPEAKEKKPASGSKVLYHQK